MREGECASIPRTPLPQSARRGPGGTRLSPVSMAQPGIWSHTGFLPAFPAEIQILQAVKQLCCCCPGTDPAHPPGAAAFCRECRQQHRDRGDCTSLPILKRQSHTQARGTGSSVQLHSSLSLRSVPARQALISTSTRKMQRKEQSMPNSLKNIAFHLCL